jgi:coenzyme PQQ precursor peptide PqqA
MYWTTPTLVEICIGLEINGYLSGLPRPNHLGGGGTVDE